MVTHQARFNFMREARIWYSRDPEQSLSPGGFENEIVVSDEFFPEVTTHSIPTDLEAAKALSIAVQAMNFYRLSGGQFIEERGQPDLLGLLQQIGAGSTPGA